MRAHEAFPYLTDAHAQSFFRRTIPDNDTDCLLWPGETNAKGYPVYWPAQVPGIPARTRIKGAHRLAYMFRYGLFDPQLHVLHRCDRPACVEPTHLFLGTNMDNVRDCVAKGRHSQYKLDEPTVRAIRTQEGMTLAQMAEHYGISRSTVIRIRKRRRRPSASVPD